MNNHRPMNESCVLKINLNVISCNKSELKVLRMQSWKTRRKCWGKSRQKTYINGPSSSSSLRCFIYFLFIIFSSDKTKLMIRVKTFKKLFYQFTFVYLLTFQCCVRFHVSWQQVENGEKYKRRSKMKRSMKMQKWYKRQKEDGKIAKLVYLISCLVDN